MTCARCQHDTARKFGTYGKKRIQRYRCTSCKATFADPNPRFGTHYTDPETAAKVLQLMLEGMSVRAISRITGMHKDTILSLMNTAAVKARTVLDKYVRNVTPRFVQVDEMWGFVHSKDKALDFDDPKEWGSAYLWLAIDSETKLYISHYIGPRNSVSAFDFCADLRHRTVGRYQITSDSFKPYVAAVQEFFGTEVDFGQLHKYYGKVRDTDWYGSGRVLGAVPRAKIGKPNFKRISTSHIERANLNVRMHLRRYTRLTNAFSKTLANLRDATALYIAYYNFCRAHQTLKQTPAMAAGITNHVWTITELLGSNL